MSDLPIRALWWIGRHVYRLVGMRTEGARAIAFDAEGRLLLVRARYGRRDRWQFPGGGIDRGEAPEAAAIRETREEAGVVLERLEPGGVFARRDGRWRDTVHVFRGTFVGEPTPDGREIAEARAFAMDALPRLTRATRRRLDELAGRREPDGQW